MVRLRDVLLLVRAPLAATAVGDVVTGFVLAASSRAEPSRIERDAAALAPAALDTLAVATLASATLYWAGMALNDLFDLERDRTLAPNRPLPAGRLSARFAAGLGLGLLLAGIGLAFQAGGSRGALAAATVANAVVLYDAALKKVRLIGALGMALCRGANVLLGGVVATAHAGSPTTLLAGYAPAHAVAVASYVFLLTLLSTYEDEEARPIVVALVFGGALALVITYGTNLPSPSAWIGLGPLLLVVTARFAETLRLGTRASGRATTRWLLRGLLLVDAGALLGVGQGWWALLVLALFLPYLLGARLLLGQPPSPAPVK